MKVGEDPGRLITVRPSLEVADIFRVHGPAWRAANAGHISLAQLKVMSAIESCRTAALGSGGHIEGCEDCRPSPHRLQQLPESALPKVPGRSGTPNGSLREADLLPVGYFHVVFTVPAEVADLACHNKAVIYDLLSRVASETMVTIAADPRHLPVRASASPPCCTPGARR